MKTLLGRLRGRARREHDDVTETIWLPVAMAASQSIDMKAERPLFVVERVLGHCWAVSCDPAAIASDEGDAALPARLAVEDCRKSVANLAARASLTFTRGRSLEALELEPVRAGRYPFRLRYRRRPSQRVDFEAVDVVTGRRAGSSLRAAIAAALIDADRSRAES